LRQINARARVVHPPGPTAIAVSDVLEAIFAKQSLLDVSLYRISYTTTDTISANTSFLPR